MSKTTPSTGDQVDLFDLLRRLSCCRDIITDTVKDILYCAACSIRNDDVVALQIIFESVPEINIMAKEEFLSMSVSHGAQRCFNHLYGIGIKSYKLMQYCSNYQDFLKMEEVCKINHIGIRPT